MAASCKLVSLALWAWDPGYCSRLGTLIRLESPIFRGKGRVHFPLPGFSLWATLTTGLMLLMSAPLSPRKHKCPDSSGAESSGSPSAEKPEP